MLIKLSVLPIHNLVEKILTLIRTELQVLIELNLLNKVLCVSWDMTINCFDDAICPLLFYSVCDLNVFKFVTHRSIAIFHINHSHIDTFKETN